MRIDSVEAISAFQKFESQGVYFGANTPTNPNEGDMWFENPEIGDYWNHTQPWYWNATFGLWLTNPFILDFGMNLYNASNLFQEKTIPFHGVTQSRMFVRHIYGLLTNTSTAIQDATNFYTFHLRYTTGTATPLPETNLYTIGVNSGNNPGSLAVNASRRITELVSSWIPGNAWSFRVSATRTGTPGNIRGNFQALVQYSRGA